MVVSAEKSKTKSRNTNKNKKNIGTIIAVTLVIVSFLAAVKLLSGFVSDYYDSEMIVCLDAGHGGSDFGAVSTDRKRNEKDDNLKLTLLVRKRLEDKGVKVVMTREDDSYVSLKDRCKIANKKQCDLFVAIHRNSSSSGSGFEAWISDVQKKNEGKIAKKMLESLSQINGQLNRGVKKGYRDSSGNNYYVNANTNMPSILLEVGFITDDNDNKYFDEDIEKYADAIANEIYEAVS